MADVAKEDAVSEPQSPRTGTIELLQVLSLLAVPIAVLLYKAGYPYSASLAAMVFAVLALVPFWLAKPPQYVEWDKGFKITPERLRTLKSVGVPDDILDTLKESFTGKFFPSRETMQNALNAAIGEDRIGPWLNTLLLHAKYYGEWRSPEEVPQMRTTK